jgi:hypothetical protein
MIETQELDHSEAHEMWKEFGEAIGQKNLEAFYGKNWPRYPVDSEAVFECFDTGKRVGWFAIRLDPVEPYAWIIHGIWPEFQGWGYSKEIGKISNRMAFQRWNDIDYIMFAVSLSNQDYCNSFLLRNKYVESAGVIRIPKPGYILFSFKRRREEGRK